MALDPVRLRFWLCTVAVGAVLLGLYAQTAQGLRIETSILALLPATERDDAGEQAQQAYTRRAEQSLIFLVGGDDQTQAAAAATRFADSLNRSGRFQSVQAQAPALAAAAPSTYAAHRYHLLGETQRRELQTGHAEHLVETARRELFAPTPGLRVLSVAEDPLNLLGNYLTGAVPKLGSLTPLGSQLAVREDRRVHVLITARMQDNPFVLRTQEQMTQTLEAARLAAGPAVQVMTSGALPHVAAATRAARSEIGALGTWSLVGVVLMVLLTFRSLRPLVLALAVLVTGLLAALSACLWAFGHVHLVTLVFGGGLIGVALDYSNHFLADQFRGDGGWTPRLALQEVGPGIVLSVGCAVIGYLCLALAPLPGLRQMALFCVLGLVTSCACVLCWYPVLARATRTDRTPVLMKFGGAIDRLVGAIRRKLGTRRLLLLLGAVVALGLARLQFVDDIRLMQTSPPELLAQEKKVRQLLNQVPDSRYFLVQGADAETVLQAQEALATQLDALIQRKALSAYQGVMQVLPSQRRQRENHALLAPLYAPQGGVARLMQSLGFPSAVVVNVLHDYGAAEDLSVLRAEDWLSSPVSEPWRPLWLGAISGRVFAVVILSGVNDVAALRALDEQIPGVQWVDRVAEVSDILSRYRDRAMGLMACAFLLIAAVLWRRYPRASVASLLMAPLGAVLATLAVLGGLGVSISLFTVLALLLTLGLSVDYAIYLREGHQARGAVVLTLCLSTLGTMMSYGLLAFSDIAFLRAMGLTLTLGIAFSFVFALLAQRPQAESLP